MLICTVLVRQLQKFSQKIPGQELKWLDYLLLLHIANVHLDLPITHFYVHLLDLIT